MREIRKSQRGIWCLLFFLYILFILYLLLGRSIMREAGLTYWENIRQNRNLIPFYTIRRYLYVLFHSKSTYLIRHCFLNLTGNILLFIPVGIGIPILFPKLRRFFPFLFSGLAAVLTVELIQLFAFLGRLDVDDLILNICGMLIGFCIFCLRCHALKRREYI